MAFHSREDIPLDKPTRVFKLPVYPATHVFIHHGASPTPTTVAEEKHQWAGYQRFHQHTRGWSDIAYNFGVGPSGDRYEGRGWKRQGGATGAPQDRFSISICAIGNYDKTKPTDAMIDAFVRQIVNGIKKGHLEHNVVIQGHKDKPYSTSCPGRLLYARIDDIRQAVKDELNPPKQALTLTLEDRVRALEQEVFGTQQ